MKYKAIGKFQKYILDWYSKNGRTFPWRYTFDAYKVLVSEILLQQTNVEKVINPYNTIVKKYKSVLELADADIIFLKDLFKDLGLFYRADRIISISRQIIEMYEGMIPDKREELLAIKGIGNYTGNAILCFGYNKPYAIVDTNVIRVFDRFFGFKSSSKRPHTDKKVWEFAQMLIPEDNYVDYNYGLLDFAAVVCRSRKPMCSNCLIYDMCCYNDSVKYFV
jgi:A/G-specific adenine glycosylase